MNTQEKIAVMQAYQEGKSIQFLRDPDNGWIDCSGSPVWNWLDNEYRVKPELMEIWVNVYEKRGVMYSYTTPKGAQNCLSEGGVTKKFIEVQD